LYERMAQVDFEAENSEWSLLNLNPNGKFTANLKKMTFLSFLTGLIMP
jgi:hypothetical protein